MTPRSDPGWIAPFRARYDAWWAAARPLVVAHDYAAAFKTYPWPAFDTAPWTAVTTPVAAARLAVVTTGGLYRPGVDRPFDGGEAWRRYRRAAEPECSSQSPGAGLNASRLGDNPVPSMG